MRREIRTCGDKRFGDLFNEKRIALGQRIYGVDGLYTDRALQVKDRPQHRIQIIARKRGQDEFVRQAFAIQLCEPTYQTCMYLVVPVGQNEQNWVSSAAARQNMQELE